MIARKGNSQAKDEDAVHEKLATGSSNGAVSDVVSKRGCKSKTFAFVMFSWTLIQNRQSCHLSKIQLMTLFVHSFRIYCRDVSRRPCLSRLLSAVSWGFGFILMFVSLSEAAFGCTKYAGCLGKLTHIIGHMVLWALVRRPYLAGYVAALLDVVLSSLTESHNWPLYLNFRLCQTLIVAPMVFIFVRATIKRAFLLVVVTYFATGVLVIHREPLLWLFGFIFGDRIIRHVFLFLTWLSVSLLSVTIAFILRPPRLSKTEARKIYHLAASIVMFTGLLVDPSFLRIAVAGGLFTIEMAESFRYHKVPLFGSIVQSIFEPFLTNQDHPEAAEIAPISLLLGLGYPLIYEPILESTMGFKQHRMELYAYAGVLSTGVGDSFAAIIGSRWGRHRWPWKKRTLEGSVACFSSEVVVTFLILALSRRIVSLSLKSMVKISAGLLVSTIFEALSNADDNFLGAVVLYPFLRSAFPSSDKGYCGMMTQNVVNM